MNIQQLRAQIAALQDATMDENKNFHSSYDEGKFDALSAVDALLDSLQEEPVSKDLEEASRNYADNEEYGDDIYFAIKAAFKSGAIYHKQQMMKDAIDTTIKQGCTDLGVLIKGLDEDKFSFEDKVKVIVIKSE